MQAVRRRLRISGKEQGCYIFAIYSTSQPGYTKEYHPRLDYETGGMWCDCPDFTFRLARFEPTIFSPAHHVCKHLKRVQALFRKFFEAIHD